jgi:hypothetical protein
MAFEILEILGNISFVTARFGYTSFDEWKFVYLASVDILSAYSIQAKHFIERHTPGIHLHLGTDVALSNSSAASSADALFFLDTLEYFIPILPADSLPRILPVLETYLSPPYSTTRQAHLESAHTNFLALLARGSVLNHIPHYLSQT